MMGKFKRKDPMRCQRYNPVAAARNNSRIGSNGGIFLAFANIFRLVNGNLEVNGL